MQNFRQLVKKFFLLTVFLVSALAIAGCGGGDDKPATDTTKTKTSAVNFEDTYNSKDTWLIEWYLCGADLESSKGFATNDLQELFNVKLPENVKVLIQTGGSNQWQNNVVNSNAIERFLYDSNGLQRLETLPDADMGNVETLKDFIRYGKENYQADHRIFVFWDHGGGSAGGICIDERTNNVLSLNDVRNAFTAYYEPNAENPPFEIIGFDACLMATYETANCLDGLARYMTASEETEPALGWNYVVWVGELAKNPAIGGAKLGKVICDSYLSACAEYDLDENVTLSLIDLSKLPDLRDAYENYGLEALFASYKNPKSFFSKFGRGATNAENYGGNNKQDGYTNMVDLVDLARSTKEILPKTSDNLISAVDGAVVYKVNGKYRDKGGGLSGFYSYDGNEDSLVEYINLDSAPDTHKLLYYYLISGDLPDEVKELLANNEFTGVAENTEPPAVTTTPVTPPTQTQDIFQISQLDDLPVDIDKDGNAFVKLNENQMDLLSSVHCQLIYMSIENDVLLYLGSDSDIDADWDKGIFTDNFRAVWPMLDGHPVYVEIVAENDGYNLYSIPIKLNGVECNLQVAYVYETEKYYIIGAKKAIDSNGMSDRDLIKLRPGDEITTIHYVMSISGDDKDFTKFEAETFTVGDNPTVKDENLANGQYAYTFEFLTPTEESAYSNYVIFAVNNGEITTTVDNDQ